MAAPSTPSNFAVQTANQQILLSWNISAGATSYQVQRSLDGVTYSNLGTSSIPSYLDTAVSIGVQYWYQVAAVNGSASSVYTVPQYDIPAPTGEMSLYGLRKASQQRADRIGNNFVKLQEWNFFIDQAMYELYDLLIDVYEDYFMAPRARFNVVGNQFIYPLPNGSLTFQDGNSSNFVASPLYKLLGVDLALNNAQNSFVTVTKYNFIDRNNYVYPNSNSTIYGVFNLSYRMMGTNIEFIPTPTAGQTIQLCYIPRLPALLKDTDITTIGFSGWLQYVIIRAAKYALDKEESDTSKLDEELAYLSKRIEASAQNRDAGQPDKVSDVRRGTNFGGSGPMNGFKGGWILLVASLLPSFMHIAKVIL